MFTVLIGAGVNTWRQDQAEKWIVVKRRRHHLYASR
jgi:hypothetical protein